MGTPRRTTPRKPRPIAAYDVKGYDPKTIYQKIRSEKLPEILELDPRYVPWFYVSNIVERVLARVYGQGPFGPVQIKCNEEGSLYVAGLGGGYTRNETKSGAAPDAYGAAILLTNPYGRIDIFTLDNKMVFKRSRDNVTWDDEIFLFKDSFYSIDVTTKAFNIKNYAAGSVANYYIVGWF